MTDPTLLRNKTIFIVEDNVQNRLVFQMILTLSGARVEFERLGRKAVPNLQVMRSVDLIILDLMLFNGTSGFDIYSEIRTFPQFDHIPVIAVSAMEPSIALPKTQNLGFSGFIAKPIDDEMFPKQLARVIGGEKVWYGGERYHDLST
jgi:CheY-like chemotaxis protein